MTLNLTRRLVKGTPLTAAEHDGNLDKLEDGIEAAGTDLSYTAATRTLASSTGADVALPVATTSAAGLMASTDKAKLDGIEAGAEVNVNADWNAGSGDAQILNKPILGTAAATAATDYATAAQGSLASTAVQSVTGTAPIASSGGTTPAISISAATTGAAGSMSAADKTKLDGIAAGAQVNVGTDLSYTASSRLLASSTGADVTLPEATTTLAGLQSAADKTRIDQLGEGGSPSLTGLTITGTAPVVIPHIHGSIAGNFYVHVKNTSGGPLAAGTAVYATGSVGDTDRITVAACDPTDPLKMPAIGVLDTTLANNDPGDAVVLGELRPINTAAYTLGAELYVGAAGALVATLPASGIVQRIGVVARVQSNTGTIVVGIGPEMARVGFTGAHGDLSGLPSIPAPADAAPAALAATAAIGSSADYAREDHAHQRDSDVIVIPVGDESSALTTGTNRVRFRMPFAATLLAVRANVNTAPTGSTLIVDVNEAGASVLGTKLSIDATEFSSTTAASAATITDSSLADDAEISIDIDQIGSTVAGAGLKVSLFVRRV